MLQNLDRDIRSKHSVARKTCYDYGHNYSNCSANSLKKYNYQQCTKQNIYWKRNTHSQDLLWNSITDPDKIEIYSVPGHSNVK